MDIALFDVIYNLFSPPDKVKGFKHKPRREMFCVPYVKCLFTIQSCISGELKMNPDGRVGS